MRHYCRPQLVTVGGDRHQEAGAGALLLLGTGVHHALAPHPGVVIIIIVSNIFTISTMYLASVTTTGARDTSSLL